MNKNKKENLEYTQLLELGFKQKMQDSISELFLLPLEIDKLKKEIAKKDDYLKFVIEHVNDMKQRVIKDCQKEINNLFRNKQNALCREVLKKLKGKK